MEKALLIAILCFPSNKDSRPYQKQSNCIFQSQNALDFHGNLVIFTYNVKLVQMSKNVILTLNLFWCVASPAFGCILSGLQVLWIWRGWNFGARRCFVNVEVARQTLEKSAHESSSSSRSTTTTLSSCSSLVAVAPALAWQHLPKKEATTNRLLRCIKICVLI